METRRRAGQEPEATSLGRPGNEDCLPVCCSVSTLSPGPPWVWAAWHPPVALGGGAVRLGLGRVRADASRPICLQPPEDLRAGGDGAALWVRGLPGGLRGAGLRGSSSRAWCPRGPRLLAGSPPRGVGAISATGRVEARLRGTQALSRWSAPRYLALVSALASGADWLFIPEAPPEDGWENFMCERLGEVSEGSVLGVLRCRGRCPPGQCPLGCVASSDRALALTLV